MKKKVEQLLQHKDKTIPILSFPSTQLLNISVKELISSAEMQAKGMQAIAERCDIGASLNMMDISVYREHARYVDLSANPVFGDLFLDNMMFLEAMEEA